MAKAKELGRPDEDLVPLVGTKDDADGGITIKKK